MRPNNVIVFLGNSYELCKAFGLFGKENLVTGQIEYDYALLCRLDERQCGKKGKYFNTIIQ